MLAKCAKFAESIKLECICISQCMHWGLFKIWNPINLQRIQFFYLPTIKADNKYLCIICF